MEVPKLLIVKQSERFKGLGSSRFKSEKEVENIIMKIKNIEVIIKEKLFIIGRQVTFDEIDETLDYLALDKQGNMVVIELKKLFIVRLILISRRLNMPVI